MQVDTDIGAQPADRTDQIVTVALKSNIAACLIGLVLLAYLDRSDPGAHAIAALAVVLLGFATVSVALLRTVTVLPYPAFLLLGVVNIFAGLVLPVQTVYGMAFAANFWTLGSMVLVSVLMQQLMKRNHKTKMTAAWGMMMQGLVLSPVVALVGVVMFLGLGFPMTIALPAACLTVIAVIPLAALAIIIHGNPFDSNANAARL